MTTHAEPKKQKTLNELEIEVMPIAKRDKELTDHIDSLTKERNEVRQKRRAIEQKITTARINEKV